MDANQRLRKIAIMAQTDPSYSQRQSRLAPFIERFFYQHKNKLIYVHILMFLFFMGMMIIPLFTALPTSTSSIWNNLRLFSTFIFWGLWFPLVFASVLFAGRIWCGVLCPMGAASEWANKIGFKLPIPAWLKWEGTPILSFLLVTILGQTLDVRDQNSAMLEIFGGTLILALIIGLLFGRQKRAWCRHACPIGLLLGVFSRLGAVQFSPKIPHPGGDRYATQGICPTMVDINHKAESRHCIQCFRCVKPTSSGGLFVRFRQLGSEIINIRSHNPNMAEIWFIFLSTGIAVGGFLWLILPQYQTLRLTWGTWFINHGWNWIGSIGPSWLMSVQPLQGQTYDWLDFIAIISFMIGCMLYTTIILSVATALSSWLAGKFGANKTFKQRFTELAYQFTPVAMLSILLGLGDVLFAQLIHLGLPSVLIKDIQISLLLLAIIWGLYLGYHILKQQQVKTRAYIIALFPSLIANLAIAATWWPAIFGVQFSLLEYYRTHLVILQ